MQNNLDSSGHPEDGVISFQAEMPAPLQEAMTRFIERIATSSGLRELKFIKNDHG